jgi:hypothetical protein
MTTQRAYGVPRVRRDEAHEGKSASNGRVTSKEPGEWLNTSGDHYINPEQ